MQEEVIRIRSSAHGVGDAVCGAYSIAGFQKKYPDKKVIYYCRHPHWLQVVEGIDIRAHDEWLSYRESGEVHDLWSNYHWELHHSANRKRWLGQQVKGFDFEPAVPKLNRLVYQLFPIEQGNYIVLAPFATTMPRGYRVEGWLYLVKLIREQLGMEVILIASKNDEVNAQWYDCKKYIGADSWTIAALMRHAKCTISSDSGMTHFAGLLNVPCVAITSQVLPQNLWYLTEIHGIAATASCAGCGWQASRGYNPSICDHGCHALNGISPYSIFEEVKNCVSGIVPPRQFGRYESFCNLFKEVHAIHRFKPVTIVETGTARSYQGMQGDGWSTVAFGWWAEKTKGRVFSVDISKENIEVSRNVADLYKENITWVIDDSVKTLKNFNQKIDVLYLDSFDSHAGQEKEAQEHQLAEIKAAMPHLHEKSLVLLDDIGDDLKGGKGELSITYLKRKGFTVIQHDKKNKQVLMKKSEASKNSSLLNKDIIDTLYNIRHKPVYQTYSQMGEESIVDYMAEALNIPNSEKSYFVEFGAADGKYLSNTRHLLEKGWSGLMMDVENQNDSFVKKEFITAENICQLLDKYNVPSSFEVLSIDIDGNDYWVLNALLERYSPAIIVTEFNGTLPKDKSIVMKYSPGFQWKHDNYYGYSFAAGKNLLEKHGYSLVFQMLSVNLFFVKNSLIGGAYNFEIDYEPSMYHPEAINAEWVEV
jgi:hypothetical protein